MELRERPIATAHEASELCTQTIWQDRILARDRRPVALGEAEHSHGLERKADGALNRPEVDARPAIAQACDGEPIHRVLNAGHRTVAAQVPVQRIVCENGELGMQQRDEWPRVRERQHDPLHEERLDERPHLVQRRVREDASGDRTQILDRRREETKLRQRALRFVRTRRTLFVRF